ncbi:MAG TPA: ketoacyl-ACP synthase III, partial [Segetibacter sp.]
MVLRTVITGTGSYIPTEKKTNPQFSTQTFYTEDKQPINVDPAIVVEKFEKITGIAERRYVSNNLNTSDIATIAAEQAIVHSGIDMETLDMIIVAQNFGDVTKDTVQTDAVPSLASRVKNKLKIKNANCIAYDLLFGCPGWIQGVIQVDAFFKAGIAKKAVVIGAETLSRVIDVHDRDSMIFSD